MAERANERVNEEDTPPEGEEIDELRQQCVEDVNECHLVCTETVGYALGLPEGQAGAAVLRALLDCADACQFTATLLLRRSTFAPRACELTAEMCAQCAEHCGQFPDDQWMVECSETCHQCADSCRAVGEG